MMMGKKKSKMQLNCLGAFHGFGWHWVYFLTRGLYGAMFWILFKIEVTAHRYLDVAKQCLHRGKSICLPCAALPAWGWGVHKELGKDKTSTADTDWSKGCPVSCGIMLSSKSCGEKTRRGNMENDGICLLGKLLTSHDHLCPKWLVCFWNQVVT